MPQMIHPKVTGEVTIKMSAPEARALRDAIRYVLDKTPEGGGIPLSGHGMAGPLATFELSLREV